MTDAAMVQAVSRYCDVPVIDYGRQSAGALVASGGGLMMSVMDTAPIYRWCVDLDVLPPTARWEDWLMLVRAFVEPLAVVGWFSITRPQRLAAIVRRLRPEPVLYAAGILPPDPFAAHEFRFHELEQFLRWSNECELPAMRDGRVERERVGETPAVRPFEPAARVRGHDVSEGRYAHDDAAGQARDLVTRENVGVSRAARCRMDQQRAPILHLE